MNSDRWCGTRVGIRRYGNVRATIDRVSQACEVGLSDQHGRSYTSRIRGFSEGEAKQETEIGMQEKEFM